MAKTDILGYIGLDQDVIKTFSEDVRLRRNIRLDQDVLKTSSEDEDERRLHQDECLLGFK